MFHSKQSGFTLIEIAIVLLIVTILLGYTVAMFPIQQELKQYRTVDTQMDEIIDSLLAYAQVNGRLPCPDIDSDAREEDGYIDPGTGVEGCETYFGYLPNVTLGIQGKVNSTGNLIDPWGRPFLYAVSDVNTDTDDDKVDLVLANEIRSEGMIKVKPDLYICANSTATGDNDGCADSSDPTPGTPVTGDEIAEHVAAVVISTGKFLDSRSEIESENQDDFTNGTPGDGGLVDKVYISAARNDASGTEYDDVVKWIPHTRLFSKMIEAGQLP